MMRNERSTLRTVVAVLFACMLGGALLFLSQQFDGRWYGRLVNDFGSIVIASVALVLVFDYWQKEAFFGELFATAQAGAQLKASGIVGFSSSFHDQISWEELFSKSTHLDIFFAYGSTWRNVHGTRIERMLDGEKSRIRVVLPDPDFAVAVNELSVRFNTPPESLKAKINEARDYFGRLAARFPGKVEVYFMKRSMSFSFYRFNNEAVIALYTHRLDREPVPTLLAARGGDLYKFVRDEWYGVIEGGVRHGNTRRIA